MDQTLNDHVPRPPSKTRCCVASSRIEYDVVYQNPRSKHDIISQVLAANTIREVLWDKTGIGPIIAILSGTKRLTVVFQGSGWNCGQADVYQAV